MSDELIDLTRRKALLGLGAIGAAGAGAGMGTSALFSDEESFSNNSIQAGTSNLQVQVAKIAGRTQGITLSNGNGDASPGAEQDGQSPSVSIALDDVKPGDTYTLGFDVTVTGNPMYVMLSAENLADAEGSNPEPEPQPGPDDNDDAITGGGDLDNEANVTAFGYDSGNVNGGLSGSLNGSITNDDAFSQTSLTNFLASTLGAAYIYHDGSETGHGDPGDQPTELGNGSNVTHYLTLEVPSDVGNAIQGDKVTFDLTWRAEQVRNNDSAFQPLTLTGNSPQGQGAGFAFPWDTTSTLAHTGSGAWGTVDHSGSYNSYKQGFYFGADFSSFDRLPEFTISEIDEISYWLREPTQLEGNDIYLLMYTRPEGDGNDGASWYDSRLVALPSKANDGNPNFTPGQWNEFSTSSSASNTLVFDDTGHKSGNNVGGPNLPTLSDLGSSPLNWNNYDSSPTESDNTPNKIDYTGQTVKALSLQANSTSPGLEAYIDDVYVKLTTGDELSIDLEP